MNGTPAPLGGGHLVDGLDLSALRLFLAVAELGSVAQAAARVGISQPSATIKLRKLERLLGVQVIERAPTGSTLTGAGELVAEAARDVLASAGEVLRAAERGREGETRLTLAATSAIAELRLPALLERARNDGLVGVIVDVIERDTRAVSHAVRTGQVALGLLDGPFAPLGLRSEIVDEFRLDALVAADHALAGARVISRQALGETDLIVRRSGSGTRDVIEAALAEFGFGATGRVIEVETNAGAVTSAQLGAGVAVVPAEIADAAATAASMVVVAIDPPIEQPVRMCWNGSVPQSHLARELVRAATELLD